MNEEFAGSIYALSEELAGKIASIYSRNAGLIIWGHSMGAIVAFYCESILEKNYAIHSQKLLLTACLPPDKFYENRMRFRSTEDLISYLETTRKVPRDIIDSEIFRMSMLEPFIQDVELIKSFVPREGVVIDSDISCLYGSNDEDINGGDVSDWANCTTGNFRSRQVTGDHFFFETNPYELMQEINS